MACFALQPWLVSHPEPFSKPSHQRANENWRPPVAPRPKKHLLPQLAFAAQFAAPTPRAHARSRNAAAQQCPQLAHCCGAAPTPAPHTRAQTRRHHHAFETHAIAAPPPPTPAGASWVLRSLIREASLGIGLGVVFGAVWSTMQTGPVARRISEYYKNNPTQS